MTTTPAAGEQSPADLTPSVLQPYANARILLFSNAIPGLLPSPSRGQLAAFSVTEFGGLYGAGGIGSLTQPLLVERIQAALKPNRVAVVGTGDSLNELAERHGTTVTTLRGLNTPETLASYLAVSLSTIYSWNSSGYGPPIVKLGNLVRYTFEDVAQWLAR